MVVVDGDDGDGRGKTGTGNQRSQHNILQNKHTQTSRAHTGFSYHVITYLPYTQHVQYNIKCKIHGIVNE